MRFATTANRSHNIVVALHFIRSDRCSSNRPRRYVFIVHDATTYVSVSDQNAVYMYKAYMLLGRAVGLDVTVKLACFWIISFKFLLRLRHGCAVIPDCSRISYSVWTVRRIAVWSIYPVEHFLFGFSSFIFDLIYLSSLLAIQLPIDFSYVYELPT